MEAVPQLAAKDFSQIIRRIVARHPSISEAARSGGISRALLSKMAKGTERPPSAERLEAMIANWGLSVAEAEELRFAADWRKSNAAGKRIIERVCSPSQGGLTMNRPRLLLFMRRSDAHLYAEHVPVEGSYDPATGILPPEDLIPDDESEYLAFGPVPDGSIAVKLAAATEGFAPDVTLIFGPESRWGASGMGLWYLKGQPAEVIARFEARKEVSLLYETGALRLPAPTIKAFRPFVAAV